MHNALLCLFYASPCFFPCLAREFLRAKVCAGGEMDSDLIVAAEVWIVHSFGLIQEVPNRMVQLCDIL